ncbi:NOL7 protein, partial [Rhinopomastus cyanomelas]|nr:NOL7 protein [Rhinopomastus cyanomelas]
AALLGPASSSSEDEADDAPAELSFGAARETAQAERRVAGEAARRDRELLKEKRRRRQELFVEQKKRKLLPQAVLEELVTAPPARAKGPATAAPPGKQLVLGAGKQRQGPAQKQVKKAKGRKKKARSQKNYVAVCLKDHSKPSLQQELAKAFLTAQLYGPDAKRAQPNDFFSLQNKKNPVKKPAVQFVDESWGQEKKEKAERFKKRWL